MRKPKQPERKQPPQQRKPNDLSHCLTALDSDHTPIAVVELSSSSWLVAGVVPGVERQPLKRLKPEPGALLELLRRWRLEAERSGCEITPIAVAYEAGRDWPCATRRRNSGRYPRPPAMAGSWAAVYCAADGLPFFPGRFSRP